MSAEQGEQGGGDRTIVQDNWYENPVLGPTSKSNADTFAYSIIADRSTNAIVRRNVASVSSRPWTGSAR